MTVLYWRGWTEEQLAGYQQDQGQTNHCAKYAAATALNLLYGTEISGDDIVAWLDEKLWDGTPRYTIFGDSFGSLVVQTAAIVQAAAQQHGLAPAVQVSRGQVSDLLESLRLENTIELISITYLKSNLPRVSYGSAMRNSLGKPSFFGGHLMLLGAYDPAHQDREGSSTPWGFLSSWMKNEHLYWMPEEDFRRSWGRYSPFRRVTIRIL